MRRMIDTLFMNSLARKWSGIDQANEAMSKASLYAADQSKRLFDEQAQLARELGATAQGLGQPLPETDVAPRFAQLGFDKSAVAAKQLAEANAFKQLLKELEEREAMNRTVQQGQDAWLRTAQTQQQANQRTAATVGENRRQFDTRWPAERQRLGAQAYELTTQGDLNKRLPAPSGLGLPPQLQLAKAGLDKALQAASALRTAGTSAYDPVAQGQAQREMIAAYQSLVTLAQIQLGPEAGVQIAQMYQPLIEEISRGGMALPGEQSESGEDINTEDEVRSMLGD